MAIILTNTIIILQAKYSYIIVQVSTYPMGG